MSTPPIFEELVEGAGSLQKQPGVGILSAARNE
jgi:hypothetical protein